MDRIVKRTLVKGMFGFPMGVKFLNYGPGNPPREVQVSTVCLDGGHLEDPLGICDAETGYETMVFLGGSTFFSIYTEKYDTREAAELGHESVVQKLLSKELHLAIQLVYYNAWERTEVA